MATHPHPHRVLILKADRLYADTLRHHVERALPPAQVTIAATVTAARELLARETVALFMTGLGGIPEGDALDLIAQCKTTPFRTQRVLIVTMRREYRAFAALRSLPIDGAFDSAIEAPEALIDAVRAVMHGTRFWSASITQRLQQLTGNPSSLSRMLTDFEQVVLSEIGDGCDDSEAANRLRLSPSTISTVRRCLHRKLGVQHRGELVRVAAQKGFVRFTPEGVERPGYALLAAGYHPRENRRGGKPLASPQPG